MTKKDQKIIEQIISGAEDSLHAFRFAYEPYILRTIEKHKLGHKVPDHIEVLEHVIKYLSRYIQREEITNLRGLVRTATIRRIYTVTGKKNPEVSGTDIEGTASGNPGPERILIGIEEGEERNKLKEYLNICIERLTELQKKVVQFIMKGLRVTDIAKEMETSKSAVVQKRNRAFATLRVCIYELQGI